MTIIVKSKIERGSIRLPKKVRLPEGMRVMVRIEPILKTREKKEIVSELCGTWSDDPSILSIFKEIEEERHRYFGREVNLG